MSSILVSPLSRALPSLSKNLKHLSLNASDFIFSILITIPSCGTLFEQDGACISSAKKIEIFQTLGPDIALAHTKKKLDSSFELDDILILIL